jgi:N4-gp56 family major capsid protein
MATMTPTTGAVFIPEVWAADVLMARRNKLVMANLVDHQYEEALTYGDTVHITSIAEMTADAITPGTALVPVAPTETEQTLVIDQYYGKAIEIQDMLKRQSKYDLRRPYADVIGFALANAIDGSLLAQFANVAAGNKQTAVANLTFNGIVDAHSLLDKANVPQDDRFLVVNWAGLADLRKLAEFTTYEKTGVEANVEKQMGIVGTIYGAPVYLTNAVKSNTDAGTPNYQMLLLHKSAFAIAIQQDIEMESDRDILKKSDLLSGSCLWGVKTVRNDHAVVIRRNV